MPKNNIIFITTDEQHLSTISACGAVTHKTPNIDFLLNNGCNYTNAYSVSPVCLPARCSWMTGLYPHNSGCISNIFGASLSSDRPNLFTQLKEAGYHTSMHGKCHFIPVPYPATRPDMTLEYEHFISYYKTLGMDRLDLQDDKNNSLWYYDDYSKELECKDLLTEYRNAAHMSPENHGVFDFPHDASLHPDAWVAQRTIEQIENSDEHPHFVWASFSGPHYPVDTPRSYTDRVNIAADPGRIFDRNEWDDSSKYHCRGFWGPGTTEGSGHAKDGAQKNYTEEYWAHWRQCYFGNVVLIDEWIGKILEAAQAKWGDDFTVVFTADHGEMMGNHSLWGKNGSLFEDVIRVPLAIYTPVGQPQERKQMVSSLDVFPTIMRLAGASLPQNCDGMELEELCNGGGRTYIISECENRVAVVKDGLKLEWNFMQPTGVMHKEFYDLNSDPYEFKNCYDNPAYSEAISELEALLDSKEKQEGMLSTVFYTGSKKPYWFCGSR
ncbi:MAG: sulfatase-like hydrolase/transferase [Angelakisella sp.]